MCRLEFRLKFQTNKTDDLKDVITKVILLESILLRSKTFTERCMEREVEDSNA